MATTLKDILKDFQTDIRENEQLPYEEQADSDVMLENTLAIIAKRLIGIGENL